MFEDFIDEKTPLYDDLDTCLQIKYLEVTEKISQIDIDPNYIYSRDMTSAIHCIKQRLWVKVSCCATFGINYIFQFPKYLNS